MTRQFFIRRNYRYYLLVLVLIIMSCSKKGDLDGHSEKDDKDYSFDVNDIRDTYGDVASYQFADKWGAIICMIPRC